MPLGFRLYRILTYSLPPYVIWKIKEAQTPVPEGHE